MSSLTDNRGPFIELGKRLLEPSVIERHFETVIRQQYQQNPWFTPFFTQHALTSIAKVLEVEAIDAFTAQYAEESLNFQPHKRIAVVSDGSTPFGNFLDFFHILLSGNDFMGKLSSKDQLLLPAIASLLVEIEPSWKERIHFVNRISDFDAVIVDSHVDNLGVLKRYFEKHPHIIRTKQTSVAIISGQESEEDLQNLAIDIYLYFGQGAEAIKKIFVPRDYDFVPLLKHLHDASQVIADHNQYLNNLEYQKSIRLINKLFYMDAGTFLLLEKEDYDAPTSVVNYEYYDHYDHVMQTVSEDRESLRNIVGQGATLTPFGDSHRLHLANYANRIDTMKFIGKLT